MTDNTLVKFLLLKRSGLVYANFMPTLNPLVWLRLNETSGTAVTNYGSLAGLTITWTPGAGALGQTGKLGANEAYSYDALVSRIRISNNATLATLTTQKFGFLVKINGLGEGSSGHLFGWAAGSAGANLNYLLVQATNRLNTTINLNTTDAVAVANNSQIADIIGSGNFAWIFMDYDDANALGNGRRIRLFKGLNGTVTPLTLSTNQAGVGSPISMGANNLAIGTNDGQTATSDAVLDEVIIDNSLWTDAQMQSLVSSTGV